MITDVNPFVYSRPIAPDQIVDRDEETQLLLKNAVGGHYVRLYAPRKYGKTSLLTRALHDGGRILTTSYEEAGTRVTALVTEQHAAALMQYAVATQVG